MESGIQPVMSMNPNGNGMFGDGGSWFAIFAILALMWGGNGFFGRNGEGRCATVEDVNNSANFTRLENQVMNNGNAIRQEAEYIVNGISSLGYQNARDFGALGSQMQQCCCENLRANDQTRFDIANYASSINANTTAGIQKVLDRLCADKTEALQARVSQLELDRAMCGVIRYPQAFSYAVGTPFSVGYGGCCGCGNI